MIDINDNIYTAVKLNIKKTKMDKIMCEMHEIINCPAVDYVKNNKKEKKKKKNYQQIVLCFHII